MHDSVTHDLAALALATEAVALARMGDVADDLYRVLVPHERRRIPSPRSEVPLGYVAYYLGLLARIAGRLDDAIRHFEHALAVHEGAREEGWSARVRCELARTMLANGDDASHRRALVELDAVRAWAGETGALADETFGLLARFKQRSPARTNIIRAQGEYWMLSFDGEVCHLRHSKGLRWLSRLLRYPGEHFPVLALESERRTGSTEPSDPAAAERARLRVTRALHGTLGRIAACHAALGRHLASTVHTGRVCAYVPDPRVPIVWTE